jgi:hypothetical protein
MIGIGLDGVGISSHSTFLITKSRNARAVKIINQLESNIISVQARSICVGEKLVVETFMNTPFITLLQEEKAIVCHYNTKTKRLKDNNSIHMPCRKSTTYQLALLPYTCQNS